MTDLPALIGRYEVQSLLGAGGMGVLYLARDPVIDRHVALKLLRVDSEDLRRRFVREARSAGRLQHPNIVTVYDVGDHEGQLYIAMEYIDGDTLATLIRDDAPFSTIRKLDMVDQIADGLGFAHHRGIVHRDIKPANLMVTRGGLVKVLDFGIARLSHKQSGSLAAGTLIGTPAYMAPEQLEGALVDLRSDIYAVGLVMYELLSGRRAFAGATTADVLQRVLTSTPTSLGDIVPGIDSDLVRCVAKAMARSPLERYQDLQDLRNDLARVRRRAEQISGAYDATVVVTLPMPPTPRAVSALDGSESRPYHAVPATTNSDPASSAAIVHSAADGHADEDAVLARLARDRARTTKPLVIPANVDETVYAPAQEGRAGSPSRPLCERGAVAGRLGEPALPNTGGPTPPASDSRPLPVPLLPSPPIAHAVPLLASAPPTGATTPLPAARKGVPAILIVGGMVALLAILLGGVYVAMRVGRAATARWESVTSAQQAQEEADRGEERGERGEDDPGTAVVVEPAVETEQAGAGDTTQPPADDEARLAEEARVAEAARVAAADAKAKEDAQAADAARQLQAQHAADARRRAEVATRPQRQEAREADRPEERDVAELPVPEPARRDEPPAATTPRDEALDLVRSYVAARNTSHAAGIRRVWPSVDEAHLRRITSAFSAPLTLADCSVQGANAGRAVATCQLTQPGTTAFAAGQGLTIRRQFVFDVVRQGRTWVIAGLRE